MILKRFCLATLFWICLAPAAIALPALLEIETGSVKVKPGGWSRPGWWWVGTRPSGSALVETDLLRPEPGSRAFLRCPRNPDTLTPVPADLVSSVNSLCNGERIIYRPSSGSWTTVTGGVDPAIPYVITPRQGTINSDRPPLQWNPVAEATAYQVTLQQPSEQRSWSVTTAATTLDYPAEFPPLQPGQFYRLDVETDTARSSTEDTLVSEFVYFPPDLPEVEQLATLDLPPAVEAVEKVRLYLEADLGAAALQVLQAWEPEPADVALWQWLRGEVYGWLDLRLLAEEAYQQAWDKAQLPADLAVATDAAIALGWLYEAEPAVAVQWWRRAELGAAYACDVERLQDIWEQLAGIDADFLPPQEVGCAASE